MKEMVKYIGKRLLYALLTLFILSIIVFSIARILPGDPARTVAGPRAPEEAVEQIRHRLHLDEPLPIQYVIWLKDVLSGDLGYSVLTGRSVTKDVIAFLPITMEVILLAASLEIIGGVLLGVLAGSFPNKPPDYFGRLFAYVGIAIPSFAWAIILQQMLTWSIPLFPTAGRLSGEMTAPQRVTGFILIDALIAGSPSVALDALRHMILPALALAIPPMGQDARIVRQEMARNANKDYAALARSYGLPFGSYRFKYLLKPSLIPAVTVMGMDVASLLGNAFVVEIVFNYPGFSRYGMQAILNTDLNGVVALVLVIGIIFAIANIIVDIVVASLDPRVRLGQ
ncbi:MAG: ABC transporter permease [Candidatus Korarchaeota archaeon]|nr:ABC transporter permease [Candidatus Korarchaeota archaeon]NIU83640.1 ABC transporter permease subunit [Candidatus Thorarchaeota archaeon]NIW13867.1 ABC transporter permease subunit [Candidatus Thorarchaeota archaeon]NIW51978.1 ABC transporter permease subunit [Candidatus Korarchaeota archaeon]